MIKLIVGFERLKSLSLEGCHTHLRDRHGPLVKDVTSFCAYVRKYTQNFRIDEDRAPSAEALLDGVAELWFDDLASLVAAYADPDYLERLRPDESRFADPLSLLFTCATEEVLIDGAADGSRKWLRFLVAGSDLGVSKIEEFLRHYNRIVLADPAVAGLVPRAVRNHAAPEAQEIFPGGSQVVVIDEVWLAAGASPEEFAATETALLEAAGLRAYPAAASMLAEELVVIAMSGERSAA